ncbi:hypothetical protein J7438_07880 [Thalassotalea sp. G20_0]|uniref:hypothetical protein n=1 Tax=Thalassotalea sp. G20_0 TaxID=2821093 RepID=UPI001ADA9941|nr:hypothetical protein [Thalassotalea sp. G20_0]MBO9494003.1 hypothetical protein [Thalassotalea sp. G20_0]
MDNIATTPGISLPSSVPKHPDSRDVSICPSCQESCFQGRKVNIVQRRPEHRTIPEGPEQCPVCKKVVDSRNISPVTQANEISKLRVNRCHDLRVVLGIDDHMAVTIVQDLMKEGVILPLEERSRALKEALGITDYESSCYECMKLIAQQILPHSLSLAMGMYTVVPRHANALWQMGVSLSPEELHQALTVLQQSIDSDGGQASDQRRLIQEEHIKLLVQIAETIPSEKLSGIMLPVFKSEDEVSIGYIRLLLGMASDPSSHRLLDAVCNDLDMEQKSIIMRIALALNSDEGSKLFRTLKNRNGTLTPEELPKALKEVLGRNSTCSNTLYNCVIDYAHDLFDMGARLDQPEWEKAMLKANELKCNRDKMMGDLHIAFLKRDETAFSLWESTQMDALPD